MNLSAVFQPPVSHPATCPSTELFERSLESTSRALAGDADLRINFSAERADGDSKAMYLPAPIEIPAEEQIAVVRGNCDAVAVRMRYHDPDLHLSLAPAGPLSLAVYNELEDLRIETCASRAMSGVAANLAALFDYKFGLRGLNVLGTDTATSQANAFVLTARAVLLGKPLPETAQRFIHRWQDELTRLGANDVEALCAVFADQAEYARQSLRLIASLELVDDPEKGTQAKPAEVSPDSAEEVGFGEVGSERRQGEDGGGGSYDAETVQPGDPDEQEAAGHANRDPEAGASDKVIPFPKNRQREPSGSSADTAEGTPEEPDTATHEATRTSAYHVYTNRFDEVVHARDMIGRDQLVPLREQLDREISEHRRTAMKLANRLQNSLRTLQKKAWTFDLDDGLLDTTRLPRLVIDPASPQVYKQEQDNQTRDTVVSFLIDNSGSMRGRPIALAAMFTNILAQALERCQVSTEILGFTTRQWRGGQSGQCWRTNGSPGDPGRLSDLRHVIYKTADEPWRRARQSLAAMLWPDLLKENIDGEALLWAHGRLAGRKEQRRILVVLSDGVPADDATLTANTHDYLAAHLHQVVDWIETKSSVELLAIGVGHDVGKIYARSVRIADSEQLGDAMAHELIELLGNVPAAARYPITQKISK